MNSFLQVPYWGEPLSKKILKYWTLAILLCSVTFWLSGCGGSPPEEDGLGTLRQNASVGSLGEGSSCSTSSVKGLSQQLFAELNCLRPNTITDFRGLKGVSTSSTATFMYLQPAALKSLQAVLARRSSSTMRITSALRSLAQQYLLYRWFLRKRCNIRKAAKPGSSNHESGLALDVSPHESWISHFQAKSWKWLGDGDPVHFDYKGSGAINIQGLSIKAFQLLWNKNNSSDKISVDGKYGPQTEARLKKSPGGGFSKYGCPKLDAALVSQSVKDATKEPNGDVYILCPGQPFSFSVTLENIGDLTWTDVNKDEAGKAIRLGHREDELLGAQTRISINTTGLTEAKPKDKVTFQVDAQAPAQPGTYKTTWQMVSENVTWFGPKISLTFQVPNTPNELSCQTDKQGACAGGTLICHQGTFVCTPPAGCEEPTEEQPDGEPVTQADGEANNPGADGGISDTDGGDTEPTDHEPPQPDKPTGVVVLPKPGVCLPACGEGLLCIEGQCLPAEKPSAGCQCTSATQQPAPSWLGLFLLALIVPLITRRKSTTSKADPRLDFL